MSGRMRRGEPKQERLGQTDDKPGEITFKAKGKSKGFNAVANSLPRPFKRWQLNWLISLFKSLNIHEEKSGRREITFYWLRGGEGKPYPQRELR